MCALLACVYGTIGIQLALGLARYGPDWSHGLLAGMSVGGALVVLLGAPLGAHWLRLGCWLLLAASIGNLIRVAGASSIATAVYAWLALGCAVCLAHAEADASGAHHAR